MGLIIGYGPWDFLGRVLKRIDMVLDSLTTRVVHP